MVLPSSDSNPDSRILLSLLNRNESANETGMAMSVVSKTGKAEQAILMSCHYHRAFVIVCAS